MKKSKKYICMIAFLLTMGMTACGEKEAAVPQLLEPAGVSVDTAEVQKGNVEDIEVYKGYVVPYVEEIYFTEDGNLSEIYVIEGDIVQKGQVLAVLDNEKLEEETEALEEQIEDIIKLGDFSDRQANADIKAAKLELEMMWEKGEAAQWKSGPTIIDYNIKYVEQQVRELSLIQAQELRRLELQEKQRQLTQLTNRKRNNKLKAPFDGQVVYVGQFGQSGDVKGYETVVCLADESRLSLVSDFISETDISKAEKVYAHIFDREYELEYQPYSSDEYLEMVISGEEMKTQFTVKDGQDNLKSGQYAVVIVVNDSVEDVLTIPINSLYRDAAGTYVYKMVDGERIKCPVSVGIESDINVEILDGLQEGEIVYVRD